MQKFIVCIALIPALTYITIMTMNNSDQPDEYGNICICSPSYKEGDVNYMSYDPTCDKCHVAFTRFYFKSMAEKRATKTLMPHSTNTDQKEQ